MTLTEPIILADALPNAYQRQYVLIDGIHRLLHSLRNDGEIWAYILNHPHNQAAQISEEQIVATGLSLFNKLSRIVRVQ